LTLEGKKTEKKFMPRQKLILSFLYSADLWVPGSSCPTTECPNGVFTQTSSSTFKSLNQAFQLTYGIGSVNGTYVTDTVTIAGATVQTQQFGLASDTQQILTNPNTITASNMAKTSNDVTKSVKNLAASSSSTPAANGILGLGYPKLTAASSKGQSAYLPFVFNLASQGVIAEPIFSIYLNNAAKTGFVGEVVFGGVDNTKFTGNLTYLPVVPLSATATSSSSKASKKKRAFSASTSDYYWMVYAQGVSVTDTSNSTSNLDLTFSSTGTFILDTGTTLTYLPTNIAQQIVQAVAGNNVNTDAASGTYIVDCGLAKSTASFVLKMATSASSTASPVTLSVPISGLIIPLDGTTTSNSNFCVFGIAPSGSSSVGSNMYLIGDSVLRSAYMVFDMGNNRVGLAAAVNVDGSVQGVSSSSTSSSATSAQPYSVSLTVSALFVTALTMLAL
jgi:hypothetical protein